MFTLIAISFCKTIATLNVEYNDTKSYVLNISFKFLCLITFILLYTLWNQITTFWDYCLNIVCSLQTLNVFKGCLVSFEIKMILTQYDLFLNIWVSILIFYNYWSRGHSNYNLEFSQYIKALVNIFAVLVQCLLWERFLKHIIYFNFLWFIYLFEKDSFLYVNNSLPIRILCTKIVFFFTTSFFRRGQTFIVYWQMDEKQVIREAHLNIRIKWAKQHNYCSEYIKAIICKHTIERSP